MWYVRKHGIVRIKRHIFLIFYTNRMHRFETSLGVWNFSAVLSNVCLDKLNFSCLCIIVYAFHIFSLSSFLVPASIVMQYSCWVCHTQISMYLIKTQISNIARTTRFWNNQVRSKSQKALPKTDAISYL
jgi:hypothetical protein